MRPEVLILSGAYDFSTDLVSLRLHEMGLPFVRLNREHLREYRLTMDPLGPRLNVQGPGIDAEIGPELTSVWFRQPVFLRNTPAKPLHPAEQLERSQWPAFIRAMSIFDNVLWMNYPQATYLAECKPYQLLSAQRCGLQVPKTVISNDADAVRSKFDRDLIIKSLDTVLLRDDNDCLFTYSTIADRDFLSHENVFAAPLLAQEVLTKKTDIRVTIVGNKVFPVRIVSKGKGIDGDWRTIPRENLEYEDVQLPPKVEVSCLKLVASLGLSFGAIDLIENDRGTFFLEINPTGEWGWICEASRQIDFAIASWLSNPKPPRDLT
jgi:glutathione synthase/RimK-type ligase-like ATP-grasp enzyme